MLREPWRTRLLFLSFAVNLVAIPIAARPFYRQYMAVRPALTPGSPPAEMIIRHMVDVLPSADGARLRTAMEPHIETIQTARLQMEIARRGMIRALTRTPFDAASAQESTKRWQSAWNAWSESLGNAMIEGTGTLSPEGRTKLRESTLRRGEP